MPRKPENKWGGVRRSPEGHTGRLPLAGGREDHRVVLTVAVRQAVERWQANHPTAKNFSAAVREMILAADEADRQRDKGDG